MKSQRILFSIIVGSCLFLLLSMFPVVADKNELGISADYRSGNTKSIIRAFNKSRKPYGNIGVKATEEQLKNWDIDINFKGEGLPKGSGSIAEGEVIYNEQCAVCHGTFGESAGRWPRISGGEDSLTDQNPEKTVGSYWPYASTLYDYIRRSMPFYTPGNLTNEQVYSITGFVLYLNDLVEDDSATIDAEFIANIEMPNRNGFFSDPRPDSKNTRCMKNCEVLETPADQRPSDDRWRQEINSN